MIRLQLRDKKYYEGELLSEEAGTHVISDPCSG